MKENILNIINEINSKNIKKFAIQSVRWNVIKKNIVNYFSSIIPFDIYNIGQKFTVNEICDEINKILIKDQRYILENMFLKRIDLFLMLNEYEKLKEMLIEVKNDDIKNECNLINMLRNAKKEIQNMLIKDKERNEKEKSSLHAYRPAQNARHLSGRDSF